MAEGTETGAMGASFGIEGGENEVTNEHGANAEGEGMTGFQTTTTTTTSTINEYPTTSSAIGLPSIPSNQLTSTITDKYEGPYIGAVQD